MILLIFVPCITAIYCGKNDEYSDEVGSNSLGDIHMIVCSRQIKSIQSKINQGRLGTEACHIRMRVNNNNQE